MIEDSQRARARALVRFGFAVLAGALVVLPCLLPAHVWTSGAAVLFLVLAVLCATIAGGLWAALVATAIGALGVAYFLEPAGTFEISYAGDRLLLLLFVALGVLVGAVFQRARRELGRLRERAGAAGEAARRVAELDALLTSAPIGFALFDREGRHLYVNRRLSEISGIPADGILGRTIRQLVPAVAQHLEPALAHVVATGEAVPSIEMELATPTTGGETHAFVSGLYPIRDTSGALGSVGLVVTDLTERRRMEEALRASEGRLRRLWESNIIGMMYSSADGGVRDANDAVLQMLGYDRDDLRAGHLRWDEMTPPEYAPLDQRGLEEALERGACTPYEKVFVGKDGRRVPVLMGYALFEGTRDQAITFVLDLTERRRAEEALSEQLLVTKTITDNATAALFMMDERGYCTFMNPAAEAMTGFSFAEMSDAPLHDKIHHHHPDGRPFPKSECPLYRALPERLGVRAYEDFLIRKDGEIFPVLCAASPVFREGRPISTLLEARDLTAAKAIEREREALLTSERAARAEAERASRVKDEFVATLSHELRTPLNAIQGWAQLLRRSSRTPEKIEHGLDVVERNARLLAQLISDLLDVSRIVSGKIRLDPGPVVLSAVLETALEGLRAAAEAKGVALSATISPEEAPVMGDAGRLVQVVSNLATNAIKFTPRGGHVALTLSYTADRAILTVTDDGQGIEPEFLPHIFDRFRQADASIARRHGGLGLGLSIVKHLVELHGGAVRAESPGVGRGARFVVELPLPEDGEEPAGEVAERRTAARGGAAILAGIKVLVVEDEPDAQEIALRMLEESGANASGASSAAEALAALESAPPDVLVSDIGLPEVDGYELIRRVRAGASDVPAVALTAFARPEDRARALGAGFQAHVPKPVEPGVLVTTVARLARRARRAAS